MSYKAIIFDLDGTLLDTLDDIGHAVNRVLKARGYPTHDLDAYRFFVGDGSEMLIRRALPENERSNDSVSRFLKAYNSDYARNWDKNTKSYHGIPELLDGLTLKGVRMAVLTNKPHEFAVLCVEKMLEKWVFEHIVGQGRAYRKKPAPDGALSIANLMEVEPKDMLFLGDSGVDMQTAVSAGMYPVGALWGFRPEKELVENGCRFQAHQPLDVLQLLQ